MTVDTTISQVQETADGSKTSFACNFPLYRLGGLTVYVGKAQQRLFSDYKLEGLAETGSFIYAKGFSVVFDTAPASGETVTILRTTPLHQKNKLYAADVFDLQVLENAYDALTMMFQEASQKLSDAVSGDAASIGFQGVWPVPKQRELVSCEITTNNGDGTYKIRPAAPENGSNDWTQTGLPDLTFDAVEMEGRNGFPEGTKVLAKAFTNSAGGVSWRFITSAPCSGETAEVVVMDLIAGDETADGQDNIRFLRQSDGVAFVNPKTVSKNDTDIPGGPWANVRVGGDYIGFISSSKALVFSVADDTEVIVEAPVGETFDDASNAVNAQNAISVHENGHFYVGSTQDTADITFRDGYLRKYSADGTVLWTYTLDGDDEGQNTIRFRPTREVGGYIAVTSSGRVHLLDASDGSLVNSFDTGPDTTNFQLSVEGGVPYVYGSDDSTFWDGAGGTEYTHTKYRADTGAFQWGYLAHPTGNTNQCVIHDGHVYILKIEKDSTHDGATKACYVLRLDLDGSLSDEWGGDSALTGTTMSHLDVDSEDGDVLFMEGNSSPDGGVLNGETGEIRWESSDITAKFTLTNGFDPLSISFRNGLR